MLDINSIVILLLLAAMCALNLLPRIWWPLQFVVGLMLIVAGLGSFFWRLEVPIGRDAAFVLVTGSAILAIALGVAVLVRHTRALVKRRPVETPE